MSNILMPKNIPLKNKINLYKFNRNSPYNTVTYLQHLETGLDKVKKLTYIIKNVANTVKQKSKIHPNFLT